ncbi:uncharacterized protein FTOL_13728 [Fusarium torulosum]|uniref:Uncharacterized protein n=1 Tax=Fusarium torulosum TaxID=33205 RepID=A0AAE8SQI1_9HYPO|nr:uncharacterized protein FTOL_13728 [Fusarium torulosum]
MSIPLNQYAYALGI